MQTRVKWIGGATFEGISEKGHRVIMDGPPEHGGRDEGIRPMEMLLLGLGGCAAFYVTHILRKSQQTSVGCEVEIIATREEQTPKLITQIHVHYILSGPSLNKKQIERAVQLSSQKYCSASLMLSAVAEVSHDFEINDG